MGGTRLMADIGPNPDLYCTHCRCPAEICSVGVCPGRFTRPVTLEELLGEEPTVPKLLSSPDWTRWQDEPARGYAIRLVSQVVFAAGEIIDNVGANVRDRLWGWADELLEVAHPTQPPIEFDIN
jgi:hypothetical protein